MLTNNALIKVDTSAGVLKFKRQAEQLLEGSGVPFVLLRPGRLTDGPYTSYDLNTLLQVISNIGISVILQLLAAFPGWEASHCVV